MAVLDHDNAAVVHTALALNKLEDCLNRLGDALEGLHGADNSAALGYAEKQHDWCLHFLQKAQENFVMCMGVVAPQFVDLAGMARRAKGRG